MKNKENIKTIILIIILLIPTIVVGYTLGKGIKSVLSDNKKNDEEIKENVQNKDDDNQVEEDNIIQNESREYNEEYFEDIIEYDLGALLNKNTLNELTNQEKLRILISLYQGEKYGTIKVDDLKKIHENSIIKNLKVTYTDVYDYYTKFSSDEKGEREIGYKYNKETETLTYTGVLGHGALGVANIIYKDLISFEIDDNKYTIKYKFVFGNTSGDGPTPYTLYYSGIDAYNDKNSFKKFDYDDCIDEFCSDYETPAVNYIKDNYDKIKNKLYTYTYEFEVEDNNLVITKYNVN